MLGGFWMKIWRFPLSFDAFGGFWMEISVEKIEIPLSFDAFGSTVRAWARPRKPSHPRAQQIGGEYPCAARK